jgi:hypothetical protein
LAMSLAKPWIGLPRSCFSSRCRKPSSVVAFRIRSRSPHPWCSRLRDSRRLGPAGRSRQWVRRPAPLLVGPRDGGLKGRGAQPDRADCNPLTQSRMALRRAP